MALSPDDPYYDREIVPNGLVTATSMLLAATGLPARCVGTRGNLAHTSGSHRSQEFITKSPYSTNRTYTVQSGLDATQVRYIAGLDFQPTPDWGSAANRQAMIGLTRRVTDAMKRGELDACRQFFGTLDGRTVYGWDNPTNRQISADDSHLDHGHGGWDRKRLNDMPQITRFVGLLIGDDFVTTADEFAAILRDPDVAALMRAFAWQYSGGGTPGGKSSMLMSMNDIYAGATRVDEVETKIDTLTRKFDELLAALAGSPGGAPVPMSISLSGTVSGSISASGTATPITPPPASTP